MSAVLKPKKKGAASLASSGDLCSAIMADRAAPFSDSLACVVCGAALQAPSREPYPVCRQVACRMVMARRAEMGDMLFKPYLERHVRQLAEEASRNRRMQERAVREAIENDAGWATLLSGVPDNDAERTRTMVLPSGPRRQVKLSRLRRKRYGARLHATIDAAFAAGALSPSQDDAAARITSNLPSALCAACGGGCCTSGGDHAYLSVGTIRRYIGHHPGAQAQEVFAAYRERLPARSLAGSCIHHSAQGCTLNRDMRSDICNHFACPQLQALEGAQRSATPVHTVFVVRRKLDHWAERRPDMDNAIVALAVLTETGMRTLSPIAEN